MLFQVDCLSPLHLVVLLGFHLVPSSRPYFSAISFSLTLRFCGLLFAGCRVVVPLASGFCPLVGEVCPGAYAGFLVGGTGAYPPVGGTGAYPLVGGAGSCPSGGQCCVKGCV